MTRATREAAIEAMGRAAMRRVYVGQDWVEDDDLWREYWDKERLNHPYGDDTAEDCEAQLDGLLDYLEAHADKWGYKHMEPPGVRDLIVVLRKPKCRHGVGLDDDCDKCASLAITHPEDR